MQKEKIYEENFVSSLYDFCIAGYSLCALVSKQPVATDVAIAAVGMPQMIKFSAPMCSDCQTMAEVLNQVAPQYKDKVEFVEISVNQKSPQVAEMIKKYEVKLVPTMIFTNAKGEQVARVEGSIPKEELVKYLEQGLQ